ncbi:MAG TPA: MFS transporter [Burkholderiaceae bacterium]|nr:MFS transporter [Burkholderiaceae bacterium]
MTTTAGGRVARPARILPVIIVSQFAGTALWFAGNAVFADLQRDWALGAAALGHLTSAVQLGFITGTLVFAVLTIADRFSPRAVFLLCSLAGALANAAIAVVAHYEALLLLRFATGFFLAGIYPVGMRIAAGWYRDGLGNAIGWLVAALVLGTAFPHLLAGLDARLPWQAVAVSVSLLSAAGGVLMYALVPDGPALSSGGRFDPAAIAAIFRSERFRASAFGYFGHMWELYAFWAFVPIALAAHAGLHGVALNVSLWSFAVIAAGSVGSGFGGLASLRAGSARVAFAQLGASGACCLASPLAFVAPTPVFLAFLLFWGIVVVGDSPQFSALNAQNAPKTLVGSALTIANCIGFAITIVSIQLLSWLSGIVSARWLFVVLALGPLAGLFAMSPLLPRRN